MTDKVSLLGTIGTWVATFLAVLALVGVIGPILIYRATRTVRYRALRTVDDYDYDYISRGLKVWSDKRILRRVRAPLLTEPPKLGSIPTTVNPQYRILKRSRTPWILFDKVLSIYCIRSLRADSLLIYEGETFLPLHRHWILILGVLGRYSRRRDFGTAVNLSTGFELPDGFRNCKKKSILSGLTGLMILSPNHVDGPTCRILFHMHLTSQMEDLNTNDVALSALIHSFFGYLSLPAGGLIYAKIPWSYGSGDPDRDSGRLLHAVKRSEANADTMHTLLRTLQLPIPEILELQVQPLTENEKQEVRKLRYRKNIHTDRDSRESTYIYLGQNYVRKRTVYLIYLAILELQFTSFSFLNGMLGDDRETSIHLAYAAMGLHRQSHIYLDTVISLTLAITDDLIVSNTLKTELKKKLQKLPKEVQAFTRTNARVLHQFDDFLRRNFHVQSIPYRIVSILAMGEGYNELMRTLEAMTEDVSSARSSHLVIDLDGNKVKVPWNWNASLDFHFNAHEVFDASRQAELNTLKAQHGSALNFSFQDVVLACLQAKVEVALLQVTIDAEPLSSFLGNMDDISYIASSPKGFRPVQDVRPSRSRRRAEYDESQVLSDNDGRNAE